MEPTSIDIHPGLRPGCELVFLGVAAGTIEVMASNAANSDEAVVRPTPLPFNPIGKTHYTREEIHALFEGLPPATDDDRTILRAHPDRPATREELIAFCEEEWARYRAEHGG